MVKVGLLDENKLLVSFFFVGFIGVGKMEVVKVLVFELGIVL